MARKHKKHTHTKSNWLTSEADLHFRAFVAEHNAAVTEADTEPEVVQPDNDFAERFLTGMRRALGVAE